MYSYLIHPLKTLFILILFSLCLIKQGWAWQYTELYSITREPSLIMALQAMSYTSAKDEVQAMLDRNVHICFKDLSEMGKTYKKDDAISWLTDDGQLWIYIHQKHETAPPQALAALISHEAMHRDENNSIAEEQAGWTREEATWRELVKLYPNLKTIKLKQYPLVDRLNALSVLSQQGKLASMVAGLPAYQGLPEHSPGF